MNLRTHGFRGLLCWSGLLCLLFFAFPSSAFPAPSPDPCPPLAGFSPAAAPAVPVLVAESWWTPGAMYKLLANFLTNRGHMIQFCIIGMIVALFVIMRNKWW
jgi:hypothetical protein